MLLAFTGNNTFYGKLKSVGAFETEWEPLLEKAASPIMDTAHLPCDSTNPYSPILIGADRFLKNLAHYSNSPIDQQLLFFPINQRLLFSLFVG